MFSKTILFTTIKAANFAYNTLQPMIDVALECNAITYNTSDEEIVKWLIEDNYCRVGKAERIYPYRVIEIAKSENTTIYQYNQLQIEQKSIPPADWEFITTDGEGKVVDKTWWGYEDGKMNIGMYIANFL